MNRRLLLVIPVILIIIIGAVFFSIKRAKTPVALKDNNTASVSVLLAQARDFEAKGNLLDAKSAYQKLTSEYSSSAEVMNWQKKAEDLNVKILFSFLKTPKSTLYEIKPGDTLTKIAREFKTTTELIMKSNRMSDDKIIPGKKIKINMAHFSLLIYKSQNILILKADEDIFKTYTVSTGTNNSTPAGNFKIVNKLPNPTWFKAGAVAPPGSPDNVLGTRWMGFDLPGYGIHGTVEPQSLGKQVTEGCVRMANNEVEELYTIVPVGTPVTIVE